MNQSWPEFYKTRVNNGYYDYFCTKYEDFLDTILSVLPDRFYGIGEFGCGLANTTRFLTENSNHHHYCYDNDQDMLKLAQLNNPDSNDIAYHIHDITVPMNRRYDLIHTHGVLEHFSDRQIIHILSSFARMANIQVHYVPTNGYHTPSFGTERLMSVDKWKKLCQHLNHWVVPFNDHDLCIVIDHIDRTYYE